jgi:hypothetical protein
MERVNKMAERTAELTRTRSPLRPQFIYCCEDIGHKLLKANLLTGEQSRHQIPGYQFKHVCRWSELPGGGVFVTGGWPGVREVVKIDTLRECAVSSLPPMHAARYRHAAVYHSQYLYALGGYCARSLSECERYVCAETRWEVLPALPVACDAMSAITLL